MAMHTEYLTSDGPVDTFLQMKRAGWKLSTRDSMWHRDKETAVCRKVAPNGHERNIAVYVQTPNFP